MLSGVASKSSVPSVSAVGGTVCNSEKLNRVSPNSSTSLKY